MEPDTGNLHSRRWEKLPQAVVNLLALHSLYAYYLGGPNGDGTPACWCVKHRGSGATVAFVDLYCPLEHWITHIESVTRNPP